MGPLALLIAAACAAPGAVESLPVTGPPLHADIDGDGVRDAAAVRYIPRTSASCGFLLTVRARSRTYRARIRTVPGKMLTTSDAVRYGDAPYLSVLAEIDRRHGAELLVRLIRGASDHGGSVYALFEGGLRRLHVDGTRDDQFRWWGSVSHNGNVDCLGGPGSGRIATRAGWADLHALGESRAVYVLRGARFQLVRSRRRSGLRPGQTWFSDIPDVGIGPPFRRCALATAPGA